MTFQSTATDAAGSTAATKPVQLEIFSDLVCPWCYIGETKLRPAVQRFRAAGGNVDLRFRPYLLNPDFTGPSRPLTQYLTERFGNQAARMAQQVTAVGAEVGLELNMGVAIAASTLQAHQLMEAAFADGGFTAQQATAEELFADHFRHGRDIADRDVLVAAGRRAGLAETTIEAALTDPGYATAVTDSLAEAHALGIQAVPTFVANRAMGVQGAQAGETLLALLEKAAEFSG